MNTDQLVHLCPRWEWEIALDVGEYRPESLFSQGFIHFSYPDQVLAVANRFYPGVPDLVLVLVDPLKVKPEVRWEAADGQVYPHLYGPLNMDAVNCLRLFLPDPDGTFRTPPEASIPTNLSQLRMGFTRFADLTPPQQVSGYDLRLYRPGDEDAWVKLLSTGYFGPWDRPRLDRMLAGGRAPMPLNGAFFMMKGERPVGTACTFLHSVPGGSIPELGWVVVHPDHRGHGIGKQVCLAVLDFVKSLGYHYLYLLTEDFRLPALTTYLDLGFEPEIQDPTQPGRWAALQRLIAENSRWIPPGNQAG